MIYPTFSVKTVPEPGTCPWKVLRTCLKISVLNAAGIGVLIDGIAIQATIMNFWKKSCLSKPQSLRDSPLLRGATPFLPPRRGTCRRPRACSLIGNSM